MIKKMFFFFLLFVLLATGVSATTYQVSSCPILVNSSNNFYNITQDLTCSGNEFIQLSADGFENNTFEGNDFLVTSSTLRGIRRFDNSNVAIFNNFTLQNIRYDASNSFNKFVNDLNKQSGCVIKNNYFEDIGNIQFEGNNNDDNFFMNNFVNNSANNGGYLFGRARGGTSMYHIINNEFIEIDVNLVSAGIFNFSYNNYTSNSAFTYSDNILSVGDFDSGVYVYVENSFFNLTDDSIKHLIYQNRNGDNLITFNGNDIYSANNSINIYYNLVADKKFTNNAENNFLNWTIDVECNDTNNDGYCDDNFTLTSTNGNNVTFINSRYCPLSNPTCNPSEPVNTSYYGISVPIPDTTISTPGFNLIESFDFNTSSLQTTFGALNSFNIERLGGSGTTEVYIQIVVDGNEIVNELVRTVSGSGQPGSTGSIPFFFNVSNGEHQMNISFSRVGTGNIIISNIDFNLGRFETTLGNEGTGQLISENITFSNTNLQSVGWFWNNLTSDGKSFISGKASLETVGDTNVTCRLRAVDTGEVSPYFYRTITTGSVGSATSMWNFNLSSGSNNISIDCSSSSGDSVDLTSTIIVADLIDSGNNIIQSSEGTNTNTNISNTVTYSGLNNQLIAVNHTIRNGTSPLINAQVSFASTTGAQTPLFYLNVSGVSEANCYSEKERYVSNGDAGVVYLYYLCEGLNVDTEYEFNLWSDIDVLEEIIVYDESMAIFENSPFDISTANIPPIVNILTPTIGSTILGEDYNITWSVQDQQLDTYTTNITISNSTNTTIIASDIPYTTEYYVWNTTVFSDGEYNITITSCENETTDLFCGSDIHSFSILNAKDSNITNIDLTNGAGCIIFEAFNLTGSFDCVGERNCTGNYEITFPEACTLTSGTASSSYNVANGTNVTNTIQLSCNAVASYNFTFGATNYDGQSLNTSLTETCTSGITTTTISCIETGYYSNGTICANGYAQLNWESNNMIAVSLMFILLIGIFILLGVANKFAYFKWACFIYSAFETILFVAFIYGSYLSKSVNWILTTNFTLLVIVALPVLFLSFMYKSIDLMSFTKPAGKEAGTDRFSVSKYDDEGVGGNLG